MKEISFEEAIEMQFVMIDLDKPVKGYEQYDFHKGSNCYIGNIPFQLMSENGELSFEAKAVMLSATPMKEQETKIKLSEGETIGIVCIKDKALTAYEYQIPNKIRHQSFVIK